MSHCSPFRCEPLLFHRVWGGDALEAVFHRAGHPENAPFGESWELSDRPETVSIVAEGEFKGMSLHELWKNKRDEIFGEGYGGIERFPVLCKILDAKDSLSLQVHPTPGVAKRKSVEEKSELWYVAGREDGARMYLGVKPGVSSGEIRKAVEENTLENLLRCFSLNQGDSIFLPSGMVHGLGAGYLIFEIQQNSDTTYRLYDWGRKDESGKGRDLHLMEALECIEEFEGGSEPRPAGAGVLLDSHGLLIEERVLSRGEAVPHGDASRFMICTVVSGEVEWSGRRSRRGDFILVPAHAPNLFAAESGARVLLTSFSL